MMSETPRKTAGHHSLFSRHIIRKIFLEDWLLKLTALIITLALWFGVTGLSTPVTKRLSVPLNLSISSNSQVVNVPQQEVDIEISGDKRRVEQVNRAGLVATLDLTDVPPGDRVVSLSPDNVYVALPQGVRLLDVAPSRIVVNLEAVEERDLPVKVETIGTPAAGYELYDTSPMPPRIRVRGPASLVKPLEFVLAEAIDITGRKEDFAARQTAIMSPDPRVIVLNTVADVYVRIGEKRLERTFVLPVAGEGHTVSFSLFGPRTVIQKVRPDELKAEMYLDDSGEELPQVIVPSHLQDIVEIRRLTVK